MRRAAFDLLLGLTIGAVLSLAILVFGGCTGAPSPRPRDQDGGALQAGRADAGAALSAACVALLDTDAAVPAEVCNAADDDCDGAIDEDFPTLATACLGSCPNGVAYEGAVVCGNGNDGAVCQPYAGWTVCY